MTDPFCCRWNLSQIHMYVTNIQKLKVTIRPLLVILVTIFGWWSRILDSLYFGDDFEILVPDVTNIPNLTPKHSAFNQKRCNLSYGLNNPHTVTPVLVTMLWWWLRRVSIKKVKHQKKWCRISYIDSAIFKPSKLKHHFWNISSCLLCSCKWNKQNYSCKLHISVLSTIFIHFFINNFHFLFIQNTTPTKSFVSIRISQNSRVPNFWNFLQSRGHL